jgi:hypothetical protein
MQFDRSTYAQERIDELDLQLLQMAVPFSGRYSAVRELVAALAAGKEFVAIDQVGLVNPDQAGSGGSLQVELQLAAFLPATGSQATAPAVQDADTEEAEVSAAETDTAATETAASDEAGASDETGSREDAGLLEPGTEEGREVDEPPAVTPEPGTEAGMPERSAQPAARSRSNMSPVQRASELQARLASLPPLPFPPEAYDVRLSDLDVVREVSTAEGRNLFDYYRPPRPPAPPQPEPRQRQGGGGSGRGQNQSAREDQPAASHPSIPLKLLGIVRVGAVRYASLTDGTEMHVAAEGASLPGGYEIVEVGIDYADIKLGETQVRLTLES